MISITKIEQLISVLYRITRERFEKNETDQIFTKYLLTLACLTIGSAEFSYTNTRDLTKTELETKQFHIVK